MEFFQTEYYGNTIGQWALSLSLVLLSFIVGRLLYWFLSRWIKRLTQKTETQLDDIIIDMLEEPVSALVVAVGAMYSLRLLTLSENVESGFNNFFAMVFSLIVTWAILRLYEAIHTNYITDLVEQTETDLDDQLLPVVRTGIRFIVGALGIVIGLNNAGYDVGAVLAGLGIGGLAFALAAQDTVANMFGGVMLFMQQPFQINDRISIDGMEGFIVEIGLRSSTIETISGSRILVPNKTFIENPITNLSSIGSYYQFTNIHLHRSTQLDQIDSFLDSIQQIENQFEIIDWIVPVFDGVHATHFDIKIKYGVTAWDPKGDEYDAYTSKMNVARNVMMRQLTQIIQEQQLTMAMPIRISARESELIPQNEFANGNGHTMPSLNPSPSASSK